MSRTVQVTVTGLIPAVGGKVLWTQGSLSAASRAGPGSLPGVTQGRLVDRGLGGEGYRLVGDGVAVTIGDDQSHRPAPVEDLPPAIDAIGADQMIRHPGLSQSGERAGNGSPGFNRGIDDVLANLQIAGGVFLDKHGHGRVAIGRGVAQFQLTGQGAASGLDRESLVKPRSNHLGNVRFRGEFAGWGDHQGSHQGRCLFAQKFLSAKE